VSGRETSTGDDSASVQVGPETAEDRGTGDERATVDTGGDPR
jgi:hypothetical protein